MKDKTNPVVLITGARKGIGRFLAEHYAARGWAVIGCSRTASDLSLPNYRHFCLDVSDEPAVKAMFAEIRKAHGRLDVLINNAGIASMNHALLTPVASVREVLNTNLVGTFLFCREAAKLMQKQRNGRIVNFTTVAAPLKLEGEAIYAASKAAVLTLTQVLAREFAPFGVTVNAVGPTPIRTDLIRSVPAEKLDALVQRQAIRRFGEFRDVANAIDFFIQPASDFVTGQVIYLGGVS
ncbi:MAG: SDR family NAD(P)-dependent oxidoreductase [Verrucomicrobia bacterium]|nr:SDR family NAD(P)-dependent oxidoreductase [Verrucomicrobiota bacterium]